MFDTTNESLREIDRVATYMRFPTETTNYITSKEHVINRHDGASLYVITEDEDGTVEWQRHGILIDSQPDPEQFKRILAQELPCMSAHGFYLMMIDNPTKQYDIWTGRQWFFTDTVEERDSHYPVELYSTQGRSRGYNAGEFIRYAVRHQGRRTSRVQHRTITMVDLYKRDKNRRGAMYAVLCGRVWVKAENVVSDGDWIIIGTHRRVPIPTGAQVAYKRI